MASGPSRLRVVAFERMSVYRIMHGAQEQILVDGRKLQREFAV
eukprot:CAMPEP_0194056422 /NCGR_PEP_ID=MMETSP0009_2-20130614/60068_1 /TAXON_ID=210454 /ORGANISM="Grammatophora oceanica, Strain CCMP 410" /LENGTH=42 /DNA_ID= /DNA_START= /DNA_END= /DNA_ORIENTATION=